MTEQVTKGIKISVQTEFEGTFYKNDTIHYAFSYEIAIENQSEYTTQLLSRKWTIKDGIRQNITKLDKAKKTHITPIFCPNCKKNMKKRFDADYYKLHKKCFDCVIDFEAELKRIGAWEEYHKNIVNSDIDGFIVQFKEYVEEELTKNNNSFITESGDVESWVGGLDKERVLESLGKTIEHLEKMKK